jgi:hypothetical protein
MGLCCRTFLMVKCSQLNIFSYFLMRIYSSILTMKQTSVVMLKEKKQTPPTKQAKMSEWKQCSVTDIKIQLVGLHPLPDIRDRFSLTWVNRMYFFFT